MKKVKSEFSIKNLENISGIKAHTIRIWEKRYKLLSPERTDTNIRKYSLESLRKLLNITLLYKKGFKISKIANLEPENVPQIVRQIALENNSENISINALKLAMVNFDVGMFDSKYKILLENKGFEYVFFNIFIPLMTELGILWQTGAICPSHEHFVTSLIKQKIHVQTEKIQNKKFIKELSPKFVIFLPDNEIHELSILYLNYLILSKGFQTIFLGQSIPIKSLNTLLSQNEELHFITYITVQPAKSDISNYIKLFYESIIKGRKNKLSIFGPQIKNLTFQQVPENIFIFNDPETFVEQFLTQRVFI
ncbi:MAG: MerR family transcriptional regulator [Flavobacteriaceae bacterium]|nr:MerR family transcriptional regulator [Flavobacteriaceae bacterium]MAR43817.1 MerR family transcriptional regulator [Flavobacteriaceae bacterium]|tara:strand:+ start:194 stop:1117 length:924 start_codon:yes stop_codon:yes gene_type:complete